MSLTARPSARDRQIAGLAGFSFAAALPPLLWHRTIETIPSDFRLDPGYLVTGWTGYGLIALGLLLLAPVAWSAGRHPDSRLYPRSRRLYMGWGVTLYLLGMAPASIAAAAVGA